METIEPKAVKKVNKTPENVLKSIRKYHAKNKDKIKAYMKEYYKNHPEKRAKFAKKYYEQNKEKLKEYNKEYALKYRNNHKNEISWQKKEYYDLNYKLIKAKVKARYHHKKVMCELLRKISEFN
jgi:hypothetical protein